MNQLSDRPLVLQLNERIKEVMAEYLKPGHRVALINFPNHSNAGDPALWLGEREILRQLGVRVVYQASWASYRRNDLARALGENDTILLNGGGNFGDLYLHNQAMVRLQVLKDFHRTRTIQLPQSIWFESKENLSHLRRLCEEHRDFTLLVRDAKSLKLAQDDFNVPIRLCPDMAFGLGPLPRAREPRTDILWLARTDKESSGYAAPKNEQGVDVVDWLQQLPDEESWSLPGRFVRIINRHLHTIAQQEDCGSVLGRKVLAATFTPMAQNWLRRGCSILSRGKVVITDRLHGHLLSMMQDIPHVLLDNNYGKLRTMYETWTQPSVTAHWAENPKEALELARGLVRE